MNVLAGKKSTFTNQQTNDENALPEKYATKQEAKIPVDQFKAFSVFEEEQAFVDENVPPKKAAGNDEADCATMSTSYTAARYVESKNVRLPLRQLIRYISIELL